MYRKVDLKEYLPEVIGKAKQIITIEDVISEDVNEAWINLGISINESFVTEATDYGIKRWEKILNISPPPSDSLEDRRFRILTKFNGDLPYTFKAIAKKIEDICGAENFCMDYEMDKYLLSVKLGLLVKTRMAEVKKMLLERMPANIILDVALLYNNHEELRRFTHTYLKKFKQLELREEVLK